MRLLLLLAAIAFSAFAQPAPPGQLVDIGGRRLHLLCKGEGSPVVLLENGGGAFSVEWDLVQRELSKTTRVCAYDRAGYGWSDPAPLVDGVEQIMDDLHLLLRQAALPPPYILVGASMGALYARAYQRRHPEHVAGLIFLDGTHDEQITLMVDGKRTPIATLPKDQLPQAFADQHNSAPKLQPGPVDAEPLNRLSPELRKARHWAFSKILNEVGLLPNSLPAAESWRQEFAALRRQRLQSKHPLGGLPLIVIARTQGADSSFYAWQAELAALSSNGRLIKAEKSGHAIHLYRPDLVIQAIRELVR